MGDVSAAGSLQSQGESGLVEPPKDSTTYVRVDFSHTLNLKQRPAVDAHLLVARFVRRVQEQSDTLHFVIHKPGFFLGHRVYEHPPRLLWVGA